MSYEFECKNVFPDCDGKVSGESVDEVLQAAAGHAATVHGVADLPGEVVEKVKASITSN